MTPGPVTPPPPVSAPLSDRGRAARVGSGRALLGAFTATLSLLRWLLAGLVGIYLCSGITRVAPHEDALVFRLGRLQREMHPPGLLFALPAPFDRVVRVPTRTQREIHLNAWSPDEDSPVLGGGSAPVPPIPNTQPAGRAKGLHPVYEGYTLTGDTNIVQARFAARYRIVDPFAWVAAADATTADALIESTLLGAATQALAGTTIDAALGPGLESLRSQVRVLAQQRLESLRLGVELLAFEVAALTPPAATVAAFSDVTSAQVGARTMVEHAHTYRAQTLPQAQSDAYRVRQQTDAFARRLTTRAGAEASSFLALTAEYQASPGLVTTRLRAETLEEVLPQVKTRTILPADDGHLNLFLRDTK